MPENENIKSHESFFEKAKSNRILMSSMFITATGFAGGVLNFVFNVIISRILGKEQYGILYPLLSLSMIIPLIGKALGYVMTKEFSHLIHREKWEILRKLFVNFLKFNLFISTLIMVTFLILLPYFKSYLHLQNNYPFYLVFSLFFLSQWFAPFSSLMQSRERFFVVGITQIVTVIVKFTFGIGFVIILHQYIGVLWALIISTLTFQIIYLFDFFRFKDFNKKNGFDQRIWKKEADLGKLVSSFLIALFSIGMFQLITYLDSVLVRHLLPDESGIYAVVNQLGKASFFIASGVSFVLLPMMSKDKKNIRKHNIRGLAFLMFFLLLYVATLTIGKDYISNVLFAGKYAGMEKILPLYALMFMPYAAVNFMVNYYFVSKNPVYIIAIFVGAILQVAGIYTFHANLTQVSYVVGATGYFVFIVLLVDSIFIKRKNKKLSPDK